MVNKDKDYYETYSKKNPTTRSPTGEFFKKLIYQNLLGKKSDLNSSNKLFIDFGCGMGNMSGNLVNFGKVTGIDLNENDLAIARKRYLGYNAYRGDIRKSKLPFNKYNVALCSQVLEHVPGYEDVVKEISRVTKKGSRVVISTPNDLNPIIFLYDRFREMNFIRRLLGLKLRGKNEFPDHINRFNIFKIKKILKKHNLEVKRVTNYCFLMPVVARLIKNVFPGAYKSNIFYAFIKFFLYLDFLISQLDFLHIFPQDWVILAKNTKPK